MTPFRRVAAIALALALLALAPAAAVATAAPGERPAFVRLAHLSPDTPNVDVYLASVTDPGRTVVVRGVGYGTLSDYRSLPPGGYTVSMRPAGAAADTPPVLATTLDTRPGAAYTVAGVGSYSEVGLTVLPDDLTMPAPGEARVRVVNAAATAPRVDVTAVGVGDVATALGFATTSGYRSVPSGSWTLRVRTAGGAPIELPARVAPSAVYTVLLLDGPSGLTAEVHTDSRGAARVPHGAVPAGSGPPAPGPSPVFLASLLVSGVATAGLVAAVRRHRRA